MGKIRIALIGLGNCASSLVQGIYYCKDKNPDERATRQSNLCDFRGKRSRYSRCFKAERGRNRPKLKILY